MDLYIKVKEKLEELGIESEVIEHEPALTTEQADSFIEGIEGVRTKSMYDQKRLDMKRFAELSGGKGIKMASSESLYEKMMLPPGVVSPFGLLNNDEKDIQVYFDREIVSEKRMSFHPNTNKKTIFLDTVDLFKFLEAIGYEVKVIDL